MLEDKISRNDDNRDFLDFEKVIPIPPEIIATHEYYGPENRKTHAIMFGINIDGKEVPLSAQEIERRLKLYGAVWWYDFATTHWGTKWNACHNGPIIWKDSETCALSFETAWSPPTNLLKVLSGQYPLLYLTLDGYDGGMRYHVHQEFSGGRLLVETQDFYSGERGG